MTRLARTIVQKKLLLLALTVSLFAVVGTFGLPEKVNALSGSDWKAGRITDDTVFFRANPSTAITTQEIQDFLNAKVPNCDTQGTQPSGRSGYATRADWGQANGYAPPYTCLKDFTQAIPQTGADSYCNGISGGTFSGAQIIKDVASACGINPKSLLVLLQKEQGLVTDEWPWSRQYRSATGYGCPDTAPCDSQYYGFYNQVYRAARQFKIYARNPAGYNFEAGYNNQVGYNPSASCGNSTVYIQNQSTAGLYNYTPYQPNAGALANLTDSNSGGTSDCGAYGNRNYWWYFHRWFGTPYAFYAASNSTIDSYADEGATQSTSTDQVISGDRVYVIMRYRNNGDAVWSNSGSGTVRLAVHNGSSPFCDASWINCERVVDMQESTVGPGGTATFKFWYKAPSVGGVSDYATSVGLIAEGITHVISSERTIYTRVLPRFYAVNNSSVSVYASQSETSQNNALANEMNTEDSIYIVMRFRNNGNAIWRNTGSNAVRLSIIGNTPGAFRDPSWISDFRVVDMQESTVGPGGTATFKFWYKAPSVGGVSDYATRFGLISENTATMIGDQPIVYTRVKPRFYAVNNSSVSTFTDSNETVVTNNNVMQQNTRNYIVMRFRNNGNAIWRNTGSNAVRLSIIGNTPGAFRDPSWISDFRVVDMQESTVGPGGTATFKFWYKAPSVGHTSDYATRFGLVSEHTATMVGDQPVVYTRVNQ